MGWRRHVPLTAGSAAASSHSSASGCPCTCQVGVPEPPSLPGTSGQGVPRIRRPSQRPHFFLVLFVPSPSQARSAPQDSPFSIPCQALALPSLPDGFVPFWSSPHRGRRQVPPRPARGHSRAALPGLLLVPHDAHGAAVAAVSAPGTPAGGVRVPGWERPRGGCGAGL